MTAHGTLSVRAEIAAGTHGVASSASASPCPLIHPPVEETRPLASRRARPAAGHPSQRAPADPASTASTAGTAARPPP